MEKMVQMSKSTARSSNIELLRILAVMGVVILHYNYSEIGGAFKYAVAGSMNYHILYFLESLVACAVDLFVLITGYFLSDAKRVRLIKPVMLVVQVVVFSEFFYLLEVWLGQKAFSVSTAVKMLIPYNWFVFLYCTLYLISPYLNILLCSLPDKVLKKMVALLFVLFSVYPTLLDFLEQVTGSSRSGLSTIGLDGSGGGYTIVNFVFIYILGAFLKKNTIISGNRKKKLLILLTDIIAIYIFSLHFSFSWEYCNPLVIIEATLLFSIFRSVNLGPNRAVNTIAKASFTVYLSHAFFLRYTNVEKYVVGNIFMMLFHIGVTCVIIYGISWLLYWGYTKIMNPLNGLINNQFGFFEISVEE